MDAAEQELLAETLRKTMTTRHDLDAALTELGWPELLAEVPDVAIPLVFRLLGETGAQAPLLNDVLLNALGRPLGGTLPLPYTGGSWVVWDRTNGPGSTLDRELPLRPVTPGAPALADEPARARDPALAGELVSAGELAPLAMGRQALAWWLVGTGRAMLELARSHALDRTQFGRPIASFQAVRHRLAETLVALDGAEATLAAADGEVGALLAKAAAGQAALTAARHCQQVMGGIGFTAEHALHRHVRRALVLDGLLGSARVLTRQVGALLREEGSAPRLMRL